MAAGLEECTRPAGPRPEENPRHRVRLTDFYLARTPVTREQYQAFLSATGYPAPPFWHDPILDRPRFPAAGPSYIDAIEFCRWAADERGEGFRLARSL